LTKLFVLILLYAKKLLSPNVSQNTVVENMIK